jgi:multiple sugar transport system substrate-binding protein
MFVGQQFPTADQADLDFFPFPEVDSNVGADALDAPIDGFLMAKKPRNEEGARKLLAALAKPAAEQDYVTSDPTVIAVGSEADTSKYSALQLKGVELVKNAKNIAQFLDRDTRPDFSSTVMIPSIQAWIKNPGDTDGILKSIESQKKTIFASQ